MQYLLLIYSKDMADIDMAAPEVQAEIEAHNEFSKEMAERGVLVGGNALESVTTATTVRVRDGETLITDGPFMETKEVLGGYYMVDAENLDEAIEIAAKIPNARSGAIEVRPVAVFD